MTPTKDVPTTSIRIRPLPNDGFEVALFFLGHLWRLKTSQSTIPYWLVNSENGTTWVPLKEYNTGRRMTAHEDDPTDAIYETKFQLLRLRYKKTSPTFNVVHTSFRQFKELLESGSSTTH